MNSLLKAAQAAPAISDPKLAEKAKQMLKTNQEWSALSSLAKKAKERKNTF
ncbi:MAG: hypothetical protein SPH77_07460 [Campylobacter sp.]|uniref:hypothetical protein n=1 Tax=Campylobacter sp. TaxID=205 RepID=UPI002970502A|nr:hypothetical protein [Campylobacter sp.]MDD6161474.1 hypothetical protein [Campylobacteraceae bacterium]MDY2817456.1 hypothetical protein [Campylobacter lanienae]MCI6178262.1 hypothetical protein [Campylobacter sp.]MCI6339819.1 hypothetical protein [Campylobacter sp.]MCI6344575.1 hypothetical protein [Campylobacter sp.]